MRQLLLLLRPHQWLKNTFVFLPLFFSGNLLEWSYATPSLVAFAAFCFVASAIYCLNDIHDAEADRRHPKKCKRPIASGAIPIGVGYAMAAVCVALSFGVAMLTARRAELSGVLAAYLLLNAAYVFRLKHVAVVDVFIIATGFVLRLVAGGVTARIGMSHWIVLMTFLLALFLAFAKRRDDVMMHESTGVRMRRNIGRYNLPFINQVLGLVAGIIMVCYMMYTVSEEVMLRMNSHYLYATSVFVLAGIIRYLQLTIVDARSGSPTKLLMHDRFLQGCLLGWAAAFCVILYL